MKATSETHGAIIGFSSFQSEFSLSCDAIILPKLIRVSLNSLMEFAENLILADLSFLKDGEINLILDASEYAQIIKMG